MNKRKIFGALLIIIPVSLLIILLLADYSPLTGNHSDSAATSAVNSSAPASSSMASPSPTITPVPDKWPPNVEQNAQTATLRSTDATNDLNIVEYNGYLYFIGRGPDRYNSYLYQSERDGSELKIIGFSDQYTSELSTASEEVRKASPGSILKIVEDRIYIRFNMVFPGADKQDEQRVYSVDLNGNVIEFIEMYAPQMQPQNPYVLQDNETGWSYICDIQEKTLFRTKRDGTANEILFSGGFTGSLILREDWLLCRTFSADTKIGTISCINLKSKTISDLYFYDGNVKEGIIDINLCGNWIYFTEIPGQEVPARFCRIRTDGTGYAIISEESILGYYTIIGDGIFYQKTDVFVHEGSVTYQLVSEHLYHMDLDGSNIQTIY